MSQQMSNMMTSSTEIIFRVQALCDGNHQVKAEFPRKGKVTRNFDRRFLWCVSEKKFEQTVEMPVIWDAMALIVTRRHCNVNCKLRQTNEKQKNWTDLQKCISSVLFH